MKLVDVEVQNVAFFRELTAINRSKEDESMLLPCGDFYDREII